MTDIFTGVPPDPGIDGAELLDELETFLARFVAYPSEAARIADTLWIAHAWFMDLPVVDGVGSFAVALAVELFGSCFLGCGAQVACLM